MSDRPLPYASLVVPALQSRRAWHAFAAAVAEAVKVIISRRSLAELEPRLLADIGVTPAEARTEAARAPWDIGPPRRPRRRPEPQPKQHPHGISPVVYRALRRWRSRRQITGLDARLLKDIGVSFAEAENEANKPFWRM